MPVGEARWLQLFLSSPCGLVFSYSGLFPRELRIFLLCGLCLCLSVSKVLEEHYLLPQRNPICTSARHLWRCWLGDFQGGHSLWDSHPLWVTSTPKVPPWETQNAAGGAGQLPWDLCWTPLLSPCASPAPAFQLIPLEFFINMSVCHLLHSFFPQWEDKLPRLIPG